MTKYGGRSATLEKIASAVHRLGSFITAPRRQNNGFLAVSPSSLADGQGMRAEAGREQRNKEQTKNIILWQLIKV